MSVCFYSWSALAENTNRFCADFRAKSKLILNACSTTGLVNKKSCIISIVLYSEAVFIMHNHRNNANNAKNAK